MMRSGFVHLSSMQRRVSTQPMTDALEDREHSLQYYLLSVKKDNKPEDFFNMWRARLYVDG